MGSSHEIGNWAECTPGERRSSDELLKEWIDLLCCTGKCQITPRLCTARLLSKHSCAILMRQRKDSGEASRLLMGLWGPGVFFVFVFPPSALMHVPCILLASAAHDTVWDVQAFNDSSFIILLQARCRGRCLVGKGDGQGDPSHEAAREGFQKQANSAI